MNKIAPLVLALLIGQSTSFFPISSVVAQTPRPEYPRPQFEREAWQNLNGEWTYSFDFGRTGRDRGWQRSNGFADRILVPFCPESKLSGVAHTDFIPCLWYQRKIAIPSEWEGQLVLLNFGAVDYEAHVYIDGHHVRSHYGSGSSFTADITRYVKPGSEHNLVVEVIDNLRDRHQTGGKQSERLESYGCMYTRTTGIWQTVWLEAVHPEGLQSVYAVPDIDQQQLVIHPRFYHENAANRLTVTLSDGKHTVAAKTVSCTNGSVVVLPVKNMKLWSPEQPFLYEIEYKVSKNGDFIGNNRQKKATRSTSEVIDRVSSYAGMRKVHVSGGYFYLNNRPYFQRLVLDQGFYPDGIWTAPSDDALRQDIELSKKAGFIGARLHQKSFEERYYYWADRLGYLTWGESASWGLDENSDLSARNFLSEWAELVERDRNHPSLVIWTPFNETWNCENTGVYARFVRDAYNITKAIDPTRPVNDASGDGHILTDIWSVHDYERDSLKLVEHFTFRPGEEPFRNQPQKNSWLARYEGQPYIVDEFGGLPWIPQEERSTSWGYGENIDSIEDFYQILEREVDALKASSHVVGFCYTQITDVEQEKNGIYRYDRTPKFDIQRIRAIFERIPTDWQPRW